MQNVSCFGEDSANHVGSPIVKCPVSGQVKVTASWWAKLYSFYVRYTGYSVTFSACSLRSWGQQFRSNATVQLMWECFLVHSVQHQSSVPAWADFHLHHRVGHHFCVCMCVCACNCVCMYVFISLCCVSFCVCVCMQVYVIIFSMWCVCTHAHSYMRVHVSVYVFSSVYMCTCVYVRICVCMCMCVCLLQWFYSLFSWNWLDVEFLWPHKHRPFGTCPFGLPSDWKGEVEGTQLSVAVVGLFHSLLFPCFYCVTSKSVPEMPRQ